ncbi:MAG: M48 family metallopeptidase [Candidatus Spyradocola sp.]|jgi:predicted metal-dependent hydrolase
MRYTVTWQRRKTIGLFVGADGVVQVRAPIGCPRARIEAALEKNAAWLRARLDAVARSGAAQSARPAALPFLGRDLPVRLAPDGRPRWTPEAVLLPAGTLAALLPQIAALYAQAARDYLPGRVARWAGAFGAQPKGVRITGAAKRWGSCSRAGGINFSWRLMAASPAAVDAVVIHELTHLEHFDHSPAFHRLVRARTPDFDDCEAELKALAARLEALGLRSA